MTEKFYGKKVLYYMRTRKLDAAWHELRLRPNKSILEGAVLISRWGQMDQEGVASLEKVRRSIDKIAERVTELVSHCSVQSPRRTIEFINQILYDEMGFQRAARDILSLNSFYIDKVRKKMLLE